MIVAVELAIIAIELANQTTLLLAVVGVLLVSMVILVLSIGSS